MKKLLRIYLVLIFVGSALNAGSEKDLIHSGFPNEAPNFASDFGYSPHLEGIAKCMKASLEEMNTMNTAVAIEQYNLHNNPYKVVTGSSTK